MAKRKGSSTDSSFGGDSSVEAVASAIKQAPARWHSGQSITSLASARETQCSEAVLEILELLQSVPKLHADDLKKSYTALVSCQLRLFNDSHRQSRLIAVRNLRDVCSLFRACRQMNADTSDGWEILTDFGIKLSQIVNQVALEFSVDGVRLLLNDGPEWHKLLTAADLRDARHGRVPSYSDLKRLTDDDYSFDMQEFAVSLIGLHALIDEKVQLLTTNFPEPVFSQMIDELQELCATAAPWTYAYPQLLEERYRLQDCVDGGVSNDHIIASHPAVNATYIESGDGRIKTLGDDTGSILTAINRTEGTNNIPIVSDEGYTCWIEKKVLRQHFKNHGKTYNSDSGWTNYMQTLIRDRLARDDEPGKGQRTIKIQQAAFAKIGIPSPTMAVTPGLHHITPDSPQSVSKQRKSL